MSCYIITFEVASTTAKNALTERIKAYKNYCPINSTCWAIVTDSKAADVRDYLRQALAPQDRIFVLRSGTEGAWLNAYGQEHTDWLKRNL